MKPAILAVSFLIGVSGRAFAAMPEASTEEAEFVGRCPDAQALSAEPDPDIATYIGFRYVRSDGSTCLAGPSSSITYQDPATERLSYAANPQGDLSVYEYHLAVPEYVVRRNFYFVTQLDESRVFYFYDAKQPTGRQIPETVRLNFVNRADFPLLPWLTSESFGLRYGLPAGAELTALQTLYDYDIRSAAARDDQGVLSTELDIRALRLKTPTPPDPNAVALSLSVQAGPTLVIAIDDAWAGYYRGEKLGLNIRLWRKDMWTGDKPAYDISAEVDSASHLRINPADPVWDAYKKEALKNGHEYFAEWSFSRLNSRISTGDWVAKPKTQRVKLQFPSRDN